jgi:hypothetical protein
MFAAPGGEDPEEHHLSPHPLCTWSAAHNPQLGN